MKTPIIVAAVLFVCAGHCGTSSAQSISLNLADYFHDYELYLADPDTTNWYIIWDMDDGSTLEEGPFAAREGAEDRLLFYFLGGWERGPSADIQELTKPPTWEYFGTFDTYGEASQMASYFRLLGLRTEIDGVFDHGKQIQFANSNQLSSNIEMSLDKVTYNTRLP
ncbi:MAG: hypothetical protein AB8G99_18840 [Planctomycetaceae bacterium]